MWIANADGGSVTRVDARTGRADAAIPIGGQHVLGLAVGEGGVWVARATGADADRIRSFGSIHATATSAATRSP